jgi:hypothetical protein
MAFGDSDHDGLLEVVLQIRVGAGESFTYRIYETPGDHTYTEVQQGPNLVPYGLGADADGDGLAELMGQTEGHLLSYEASTSDGHPDHVVWQSPPLGSLIVGSATYADADKDGEIEILHTRNYADGSFLMVFEYADADSFDLVFDGLLDWAPSAQKIVADIDEDGLREIITSTIIGSIVVMENRGDNRYVRTWIGELGFGSYNAYAVSHGNDMDGNGKPEFVVGGSSPSGWVTTIYEADGDDSYVDIQTIVIYDGYGGVPHNATGDLDGDGTDELVIEVAREMFVYEAEAVGHYVQIAHAPQPSNLQAGIVCADGDRDKVDEIFWEAQASLGETPTVIYECQVSIGVEDAPRARERTRSLFATPNPFRYHTMIHSSDTAGGVRIYDLGGRLVRTLLSTGDLHIWDGCDTHGRPVAPGAYFMRAVNLADGGERAGRVLFLPD